MEIIKIELIVLLVIVISITSCVIRVDDYSIYDTRTKNYISLKKLANELAEYDIVVFGEFHGNIIIHNLQAELLPLYHNAAGDFAISMEMFERDVQSVVDEYMLDEINENRFKEKSRAWHTYNIDYKPIIEYAKKELIPVIAANVPRRFAQQVAKYGIEWLDEVPIEEHFLFANIIDVTEDAYRDMFFTEMVKSPHITTYDYEAMQYQLSNLYEAQTLKDETMAESIVNFYRRYNHLKILHFNGDFHSRFKLGVVSKIKRREPNLSIAVISPVIMNEGRQQITSDIERRGDFILLIKE